MPEPLLNIQNLSFSYGKQKILNDLSLTINQNEIISLVGWSGSGKTTLFKILTGILAYEQGSIIFDGHFPKAISYMTQEDMLLPWRTVWGNLLLLSELGRAPHLTPSLSQEAKALLSELGLEDYAEAYPEELSGGMRQRVSLARALLQKRPLLLLDEPFGSLDVVLREQIYELLRNLKSKIGCTILLVTHDFHDALCLSDRILLMHNGTIHKTWLIENETRKDPLLLSAMTEEIRRELFYLR